jgi:hypothetical protein
VSDLLRVQLPPEAFGASFACLGSQMALVVRTLCALRPGMSWWYVDVQTIGPSAFRHGETMHAAGDCETFAQNVASANQFESGVFWAAQGTFSLPRPDPGTEDEEYASIGDAVVEIRAFDTSWIEVSSHEENVVRAIASKFGVTVERSSASRKDK